MKSVFLAGSRRFHPEISALRQQLQRNRISAITAKKVLNFQKDTLRSEKAALLHAFREIDKRDVLYVHARDGYIGRTVAMEIAYAHARKKPVLASEEIAELSARGLVSRILSPAELVAYCKKGKR